MPWESWPTRFESTRRRAISAASSGFDPALAKIVDTSRRSGSAWILGMALLVMVGRDLPPIVAAGARPANPDRTDGQCPKRMDPGCGAQPHDPLRTAKRPRRQADAKRAVPWRLRPP